MLSALTSALAFASAVNAVALPSIRRTLQTSVTPHDIYSSSIGVLGCHIDTNRVAYWPSQPGCASTCIKVSANGRSVNLLHVDTSGGAHDISYDAWNYLVTGKSAKESPQQGGGITAEYEYVGMEQCADLIKTPGHKLPLMTTSPNFWISCPAGSWVRENSIFYNIVTQSCTLGIDEICNMPATGLADCPSKKVGVQNPLPESLKVKNIVYGTGAEKVALQ